MNILIIGANHCNRGAQAMLLTLTSRIQRDIPNTQFIAASYAKEDESRLGTYGHTTPEGETVTYKLVMNKEPYLSLLMRLIAHHVPVKLARQKIYALVEPHSLISEADVVIDISGFALSDHRPWWRNLIYWLEVQTTSRLEKPFMAMTQSFGPFSNPFKRKVARSALEKCSFISARGPISAQYLTMLGFNEKEHFTVAPDITYLFSPDPRAEFRDHFSFNTYSTVAIVPNSNIYHLTRGRELANRYIQMLIALCQHASQKWNCNLLFICHEQYSNRLDDYAIASLVMSSLNLGDRAAIVGAENSPALLKSSIASCDAAITSRFHGMIAALSSGVPALSIGWARKYEESAIMAGIKDSYIDGSVTDITEAIRHLNQFWENRHHLQKCILEELDGNKVRAEQSLSELIHLLKTSLNQYGEHAEP